MKKYLIVLQGGGDIEVKLVPAAAEDWICSQPDFPEGTYSLEETIPEDCLESGAETRTITVTTGSWDNDRALQIAGIPFDSTAEATRYAKKQKWEIVGEYTGYIY